MLYRNKGIISWLFKIKNKKEVSKTQSVFDADYYLDIYKDVMNSGMDPLIHYLKYGKNEGRIPCSASHFLTANNRIDIVTSSKNIDLAKKLKTVLTNSEIECEILPDSINEFRDHCYIFITEKCFGILPSIYIVYQTKKIQPDFKERDAQYFEFLKRSYAIFESDSFNIKQLFEYVELKRKVYYFEVSGGRVSNVTEECYCFNRFLLANDGISFETFYNRCANYIQFDTNRVCLSLPESVNRRESFNIKNKYGFVYFPAIRHSKNWIGCAMSYKFIMKRAKDLGMKNIAVVEDDVLFPDSFLNGMNITEEFLEKEKRWDLFTGLISNMTDEYIILDKKEYRGMTYAQVNKSVGMVFNIYNHTIFPILESWDPSLGGEDDNTIDRFMEKKNLIIYCAYPFLVNQDESIESTIWQSDNKTLYSKMIEDSQSKFDELINNYEK